jgi:hypothetical protein
MSSGRLQCSGRVNKTKTKILEFPKMYNKFVGFVCSGLQPACYSTHSHVMERERGGEGWVGRGGGLFSRNNFVGLTTNRARMRKVLPMYQ